MISNLKKNKIKKNFFLTGQKITLFSKIRYTKPVQSTYIKKSQDMLQNINIYMYIFKLFYVCCW